MWDGTYTSEMYSVDANTLLSIHVTLDPDNNRSRIVRAIAKDPNGKYWMGTRGGLYLLAKIKGVIAKYYHDDREQKSLVNNSILCITKDAKGNMWIGTRERCYPIRVNYFQLVTF